VIGHFNTDESLSATGQGTGTGAGKGKGAFQPTSAEICGDGFDGIGNHFDFSGLFYASKSFKTSNGSQVLVAWVKEGDALGQGLNISWAGVLSIPRTITLDVLRSGTTDRLRTYPIVAVETLRGAGVTVAAFGDRAQAPALQFDLDAHLPLVRTNGIAGSDHFKIMVLDQAADPLLEIAIHLNATVSVNI
jgi:hypothetical protein